MKLAKILSNFNSICHKFSFDKHKPIRTKITQIINEKNHNFYDYGEGFFYQSVPIINLRGLRNTKDRIIKLNLSKYLKNTNFLDIGTNVGAIPLSAENNFISGIGIDHNPTLINVAKCIKDYFKIKNLDFIDDDFLSYKFNMNFDVILSLANHSTFDKGINNTHDYFNKIKLLLKQDGILILESHNPLYEKYEMFMKIVEQLKNNYEIIDQGKYDFGNFYDKNRFFYVLRKNKM